MRFLLWWQGGQLLHGPVVRINQSQAIHSERNLLSRMRVVKRKSRDRLSPKSKFKLFTDRKTRIGKNPLKRKLFLDCRKIDRIKAAKKTCSFTRACCARHQKRLSLRE